MDYQSYHLNWHPTDLEWKRNAYFLVRKRRRIEGCRPWRQQIGLILRTNRENLVCGEKSLGESSSTALPSRLNRERKRLKWIPNVETNPRRLRPVLKKCQLARKGPKWKVPYQDPSFIFSHIFHFLSPKSLRTSPRTCNNLALINCPNW